MSNKGDLIQAWVPKKFHKKVKLEAVRQEKSMAEYMRELARNDQPLNDLLGDEKNRKGGSGSIPFGF